MAAIVENKALSAFDENRAAVYDEQFVKLAPIRDALHLLLGFVLADLPSEARILCVGAGTGAELIYLAKQHPTWQFTAVDPSSAMLNVCRRKVAELGIASRCSFHDGYIDSLPAAAPFDAATSLLVSQFILSRDARAQFFREIASRLKPAGLLVTADLAADIKSAAYEGLLEVWIRLMKSTGAPPENVERLREVYGKDVAVLPTAEVSEIIRAGGFHEPLLFLQTGLIHAWSAKRMVEKVEPDYGSERIP
ncbi:MAG TPA: class I SAM-dependent methyltransferase [Chthoniobacteraceae bacterium]|jgi:tRNA (cmo5U34)-methyltransferase